MKWIHFLVIFAFISNVSGAGNWGYESRNGTYGPTQWDKVSKHCNGTEQSPINIVNNDVTQDDNLPKLSLKNYWNETIANNKVNATLENNGHTIVLKFHVNNDLTKSPFITQQGSKMWRLVQFHLHWGKTNNDGSEHTIDGKAYPAEIHFVHMSAAMNDFGTAVTTKGGLMVMGFFIKVGTLATPIPLMDHLFEQMKNTMMKGKAKTLNLSSYKLESLLPKDLNSFYHYMGSLTTPTCDETVTWNVMAPFLALTISSEQMAVLRSLKSTHNTTDPVMTISGNFRPVQPLHKRKVKANYKVSHGSMTRSAVLSIVIPVIIIMARIFVQ